MVHKNFTATVSLISLPLKNVSTLFREALTRNCHPTLTKLLENGNLLIKFVLQFVVWVELIIPGPFGLN